MGEARGARGLAGAAVDGRVLRGQRNREAVVDAFISLIEEGEPRPTARAIASRAGISVRSVFQHFDDLEQIYEIAGRRTLQRLHPLLEPVDVTLPLEVRLAAFVERRRRLLEQLDPVARAARLREPFSEQLQANRAAVVGMLRRQCAISFAPELAADEDAEGLLVTVATAASWAAWYHLRNDQGLSTDEAAAVLTRLLLGALAGAPAPSAGPGGWGPPEDGTGTGPHRRSMR